MGQLLIHCSATLAFWLFTEIIDECEVRDIYLNGLPGLIKHSYIIRLLTMKHLPEVHDHFNNYGVLPMLFAGEFIFSVFMKVIPEDKPVVSAAFFTLFLRYKWEFFYKMVLTVLNHSKESLLKRDELTGILEEVKIAMSNKNDTLNYPK